MQPGPTYLLTNAWPFEDPIGPWVEEVAATLYLGVVYQVFSHRNAWHGRRSLDATFRYWLTLDAAKGVALNKRTQGTALRIMETAVLVVRAVSHEVAIFPSFPSEDGLAQWNCSLGGLADFTGYHRFARSGTIQPLRFPLCCYRGRVHGAAFAWVRTPTAFDELDSLLNVYVAIASHLQKTGELGRT